MSFDLDKFTAEPSVELLNSFKKTDLLNLAKHYKLFEREKTEKGKKEKRERRKEKGKEKGREKKEKGKEREKERREREGERILIKNEGNRNARKSKSAKAKD